MNPSSPMILIGIGGAGAAIARGVNRAFGDGLRYLLADTDAATGEAGGPFVLLGGDRLCGRGSGGDLVAARTAAEESIGLLDDELNGVRLAVIVTALGGGTGGGATIEAVRHLSDQGIPTVIFATTPFAFEAVDRQQSARGVMALIEDRANATFFLPLDKLVEGEDNMTEALKRAVGTLASAVTLFWRLVEKPGYIRLDAERLRRLVSGAGRGRFATVTVNGPARAREASDQLLRSPLLTTGSGPVRAMLCGVLAGDDLRLSELSTLSETLRSGFGPTAAFELATVNDEETFAGRLSVVILLFESGGGEESAPVAGGRRRSRSVLGNGQSGRGRFTNSERSEHNGVDLDSPTYLRLGISLDF